MRRGEIVLVALPGDYGKPRPAVIIQSDTLNDTDSILVCPLTTTLRDAPLFRLSIEPSPENGLRKPSQVMIDKITALRRDRCRTRIGQLGQADLIALGKLLALVVGIADER